VGRLYTPLPWPVKHPRASIQPGLPPLPPHTERLLPPPGGHNPSRVDNDGRGQRLRPGRGGPRPPEPSHGRPRPGRAWELPKQPPLLPATPGRSLQVRSTSPQAWGPAQGWAGLHRCGASTAISRSSSPSRWTCRYRYLFRRHPCPSRHRRAVCPCRSGPSGCPGRRPPAGRWRRCSPSGCP
jgi:hypothetical protein